MKHWGPLSHRVKHLEPHQRLWSLIRKKKKENYLLFSTSVLGGGGVQFKENALWHAIRYDIVSFFFKYFGPRLQDEKQTRYVPFFKARRIPIEVHINIFFGIKKRDELTITCYRLNSLILHIIYIHFVLKKIAEEATGPQLAGGHTISRKFPYDVLYIGALFAKHPEVISHSFRPKWKKFI